MVQNFEISFSHELKILFTDMIIILYKLKLKVNIKIKGKFYNNKSRQRNSTKILNSL